MNTVSFPPGSLHVRLHGTAPARSAPIPIPRELAAAWSHEPGPEARHDPRVKQAAAAVVLVLAIVAGAFVLA